MCNCNPIIYLQFNQFIIIFNILHNIQLQVSSGFILKLIHRFIPTQPDSHLIFISKIFRKLHVSARK